MGYIWSSLIGNVIGGGITIVVFLFTFRHERKRTIFQCLYAGKQALYSEFIEELLEIKKIASQPIELIESTKSKNINNKDTILPGITKLEQKKRFFLKSADKLEKYLVRLKLIAPSEIIEKAEMLIRSVNEQIEQMLRSKTDRDIPLLEKLDRDIIDSCHELAHLLRKDLGALDEIGISNHNG